MLTESEVCIMCVTLVIGLKCLNETGVMPSNAFLFRLRLMSQLTLTSLLIDSFCTHPTI